MISANTRAHLVPWLDRVQSAVAAIGATPLIFSTTLQDDAKARAYSGQPVTLAAPIIEPSADYDEEALPFFRVRAADGTELIVDGAELFSHSPEWLELYSAVSAGFRAARETEVFSGPWHLAEEGSAEQIAAFQATIKHFNLDQCHQGFNTPEQFRVESDEEVIGVVEHVQMMQEMYGFKVDADGARQAVEASAGLLEYTLTEPQIQAACEALLE